MSGWLQRTEVLIGEDKLNQLKASKVLIVGLGGVGSFAAEYIARAGVGHLTIVDGDIVEATNRNRQLPALISTENQYKAEIMASRIRDINPDVTLLVINEYMTEEKLQEILATKYDYVVDCIDTLVPKIALIKNTLIRNYKLISSMGAGGKTDPSMIKIADIANTYNCYLAQQLRKGLKKEGVYGKFKAVFSSELAHKSTMQLVENGRNKKSFYGTISYMPSLFGGFCASVVIRDLIK